MVFACVAASVFQDASPPFADAQNNISRFIMLSMITWYFVVSVRASQERMAPTVGL